MKVMSYSTGTSDIACVLKSGVMYVVPYSSWQWCMSFSNGRWYRSYSGGDNTCTGVLYFCTWDYLLMHLQTCLRCAVLPFNPPRIFVFARRLWCPQDEEDDEGVEGLPVEVRNWSITSLYAEHTETRTKNWTCWPRVFSLSVSKCDKSKPSSSRNHGGRLRASPTAANFYKFWDGTDTVNSTATHADNALEAWRCCCRAPIMVARHSFGCRTGGQSMLGVSGSINAVCHHVKCAKISNLGENLEGKFRSQRKFQCNFQIWNLHTTKSGS